jgi:leucyl-tRNA synthetase
VAPGTPDAEVVALATALPKVASAVDGKTVVREVVVPDKLVNLVVK